MVGIFLFAACAKERAKPSAPKPSAPPAVEKPKEILPPPTPPPILSPKREASQRIVDVGKEYLEEEETGKAIQSFQEAINIDSDNGVAYFYLAFGLYKEGAYTQALGILDRAQVLLLQYPDWQTQVLQLRSIVEEGEKSGEIKNEEKPKEGYY